MSYACTFVPGEAILSTPSDVGYCQNPSQVSHIQEVRNTEKHNISTNKYKVEKLCPEHSYVKSYYYTVFKFRSHSIPSVALCTHTVFVTDAYICINTPSLPEKSDNN